MNHTRNIIELIDENRLGALRHGVTLRSIVSRSVAEYVEAHNLKERYDDLAYEVWDRIEVECFYLEDPD